MQFNSPQFLYFFAAALTAYLLVPRGAAWVVLLAASGVFYATWGTASAVFLVIQVVATYFAALGIAATADRRRKALILTIALLPTLGMLALLKYYNFFVGSARLALPARAWVTGIPALTLLAPIGLSFFTFQHIGYLVDVFRGKMVPERHLGRMALFACFFPQVLAGPVARGPDLLPQFVRPPRPTLDQFVSGARLVLWGLFKKSVIADRLAAYVALVFGNPHGYSGSSLALGSYLFAFQIYCDFSGYSDIALGGARMFGISLIQNFRQPYLAPSIAEFWHRWHISLSTWFRDYLYIPLGGSRVSVPRWVVNIMVVFVASGFWHGANWTFLVWGGLHGFYYVFARFTAELRKKIWAVVPVGDGLRYCIQVLITFHLTAIAWIFFRANSVSDALYILGKIATNLRSRVAQGDSQVTTLLSILVVGILIGAELIFAWHIGRREAGRRILWPIGVRWAAYVAVFITTLVLGVSSHGFLYSKF